MMKKSMLLAMGLSVAALNWGVTYLHAASVASLAASAVADDETGTTTLPNTFGKTGDENTATISKSDDGKTLTIKGKGDLTKIAPAYKFVSSLPTELFKNDDNHTQVSGGEDYSSQTTYQTRAAQYAKIENFKTTYTEQKIHYYFTETGAGKYYTKSQVWDSSQNKNVDTYTAVKQSDEVDTSNSAWVANESGTGTKYFTRSGEEGNYTYTRVTASSTITSSNDDVTSETKTHLKDCNDVFVKNGNSYTQASNGTVYDEKTTYYKRTWKYTDISEADLIAKAYLRNESDFIKALWENHECETVKFEKDGDGELLIDNDIVKALLYYQVSTEWNTYFNVNTNITTLDLRAATCKNFSSATFENNLQAGNGTLKLATVTLPQSTDKTVPALVVESIRESNGQAIVTTITVPDGYTAVGDSAFINVSKATAINLPAGIETIGKRAFYSTGITSWVLPTSLKTIGDDAFGSSKVAHVTFPASLRTIGKGAFAICNDLDSINLNEGLEVIGNSAFYLSAKNDKVKVLEIPSTVKYIGPAAFNFRWYSDVYYYGEKAPISPYGKAYSAQDVSSAAFGSQLLCGNNGFSPIPNKNNSTAGDIATGYANRENYINGGTYIAVLHFRSEISDDNAETFTDITRKYERWLYTDQNGSSYWSAQDKKTVGKETEAPSFGGYGPGIAKEVTPGFEDTDLGSQFIWPSQSQFIRSYAVNSNGYKWDGVTKYRPSLTEDELKFIKAQEEGVADTDLANADDDYLKKVAYLGTRQFVLISRDVKGKKDEYPAPVTDGGRWWTLCVPCDVTKGEVDRVFGEGTHLCLFSKVDRKITTDGDGQNTLHLYFQNDTYKNKYTRKADGTWTQGDAIGENDIDSVVLYAHTPYMIYPTKRKDDGADYIIKNFELKSGDVLPTVVLANDNAGTETEMTDSIQYEFTATYRSAITTTTTTDADGTATTSTTKSSVKIPQYTYVFGKKGNSASQFWFYTGTNGSWSANKCVVERYDAKGEEDYTSFFNNNTGSAKQISTFGDMDDETTAIDRVVYHYGESAAAPVYSLGGQMVSRDGSTTGLAKGVYIQAGKKFIVK